MEEEKKLTIVLTGQQLDVFVRAKKFVEGRAGISLEDSDFVQLMSKLLESSNQKFSNFSIKSKIDEQVDICPICKKEFFPSTKARKTCSNRCRRILYIRKKKGIAPTL